MSGDFYVMPQFVTLDAANLLDSSQWYVHVLGFSVVFELPGQLVHLRRDRYQDILLRPAAGPPSGLRGVGATVCLTVGGPDDVDRLADRAQSCGATIVEGPINRPWNVRELVLSDPDGYRLSLSGGPLADLPMSDLFPSK